jgi:glycosyltransferase involved in cell wall biosynthesis
LSVPPQPEPIRVMRVIARMNIGGPAYHVSLLSGRLDRGRYATLLAHGEVGPGEESFEDLARKEGCEVARVPSLGPEVRPAADARALRELISIMRRFRPDIVHTHTAKAGALGRLAARLAIRPRPLIVHTYHGHVLEGHFGSLKTLAYRTIERGLAEVSDCLVGVSKATVDDLVRLRIAPRETFRVVPLGLDLDRFLALSPADGAAFRRRAGAGPHEVLLTCVCRLVPHKGVDALLRVVAGLRASHPALRLAVVGDGQHRPKLERLTDQLAIRDAVSFVGYRADVAPVAAAADIAVLSSRSDEGTPVSLIEAAAAGIPAVATTIGGVADVVRPETGILVPPGDEAALASAIVRLADDRDLRDRMGRSARAHVRGRYSVERLLEDIDALYRDLVDARTGEGIRSPGPLPRPRGSSPRSSAFGPRPATEPPPTSRAR